jgi:hypothetical protein
MDKNTIIGLKQMDLLAGLDFGTRRVRRDAVKAMIACLTAVRDAEQRYLDNVPDNLQSSESFEIGECAVDAFDEAIDLLIEAY